MNEIVERYGEWFSSKFRSNNKLYKKNLTDTINKNETAVLILNKDINQIFDKYAQDKEEFTREMFEVNARVTEGTAYYRALEEILRKTTDSVREQQYDIKDLQREVLGD